MTEFDGLTTARLQKAFIPSQPFEVFLEHHKTEIVTQRLSVSIISVREPFGRTGPLVALAQIPRDQGFAEHS